MPRFKSLLDSRITGGKNMKGTLNKLVQKIEKELKEVRKERWEKENARKRRKKIKSNQRTINVSAYRLLYTIKID